MTCMDTKTDSTSQSDPETGEKDCFLKFDTDISGIDLPTLFTFPFYYEPHPLARIAAREIQAYIDNQTKWVHNFGLVDDQDGLIIGKMFGVLVVQKRDGTIGYLAAFSGKLAESNHHERFVPPLYDMLVKDSHFRQEEQILNGINQELENVENDPEYFRLVQDYKKLEEQYDIEIKITKEKIKQGKKRRKAKRATAINELNENDYKALVDDLKNESITANFRLKDLLKTWQDRLNEGRKSLDIFQQKIDDLRVQRKAKSGILQKYLFDQYQFLNIQGETKGLLDIFTHGMGKTPPAGAGECAAPKLLQYAFEHDYKPLALAEFWWGQSPKSEIRKHKNYYPSCRGKCEPILGHMLLGLQVAPNPMLTNPAINKTVDTVYEDDDLLVINKPAEFLSVPGKNIEDSVWLRMKSQYPSATGPLIVHRLDMSTSGLLVIAKNKEVHKILQQQFIKRKVKKRYIALLDGELTHKEGMITLPLRVDLDNRPQQLVCYKYGKHAQSRWELIDTKNGRSRIYFYPITGRTHQLRVHAAHPMGLNLPIIGDDLYGTRSDRLYLHAERIEFIHPTQKEPIVVSVDSDF